MVTSCGVRVTWDDLPARVRAGVEKILGDRVVSAVSQSGGFSPGSADRLVTAGGTRAFVKAVHPGLNEHAPGIHRREAGITAQLPVGLPASHLIDLYDDGDWVALVLADIEGRHPRTPWVRAEIEGVLDCLDALAAGTTPCPVEELPQAVDDLRKDFTGWERLRADPGPDLPRVVTSRLDELADRAASGLEALDGDTLVHTDVRADNLLVRPDGDVVLVDWPWACRGCDWLDSLSVLVNVELYGGTSRPRSERGAERDHGGGGHDLEELVSATRLLRRVPDEDITGALAGLCGYFFDVARRPASPGLPTVRQFQLDQGEAVLGWLARRLGWE